MFLDLVCSYIPNCRLLPCLNMAVLVLGTDAWEPSCARLLAVGTTGLYIATGASAIAYSMPTETKTSLI